MKSKALQELVKKIFSDEETRLQFSSNPDSILDKFDLTEQEKKAVLSVHAKLGTVASDSQQLEAVLDSKIIWHAPTP